MDTVDNLDNLFLIQALRNELKMKSCPLEGLSDFKIFLKYHFSKEGIDFIYNLIKDDVTRPGVQKSTDISPFLELLTTLRFYATGSFQIVIGDTVSISQSRVSRIVQKISRIIASKMRQFINWPSQIEAEKQRTIFRSIVGFPGVVGAVDCTHVAITSPGGATAELFRNRKGYFSINVQAVCNAEDEFINVVVRWPGSTHDARIFENSLLKYQLENKQIPGILVGDSGYALATYLLIPVEVKKGKTLTRKEKNYNYHQVRTRNPIERALGQLKKRFPCLLVVLRTKVSTTLDIITACFVLHNIAKLLKEAEVMGPDPPTGDMGSAGEVRNSPQNVTANAYRKAFIERHF